MKAWATPSPHPPAPTPTVNNTQQNLVTHASPYTGKNTHTNVTVTTYDTPVSNQSAINVTSIAPGLTSTAGQPVHTGQSGQPVQVQTVSPQQQTTQPKVQKQDMNTTLSAQNDSKTVQTGTAKSDKNLSFLERFTKNMDQVQYENSNSALMRANSDTTVQYGTTTPSVNSATPKSDSEKSVSETKTVSSNSTKTVSSSPKYPSYQGYYVNSYADRYSSSKVPMATETLAVDNNKNNGSIAKGTLGFVDGQLTMLPDDGTDTADTDSVSTLCEDREPEIKGE